ncbi:LysR substrate-binding domain-containing protein, partial [Arthrobacter sp. I3]
RRWFGAGATGATLAAAPVVVFDRKDDLQDRWLRRVSRASLQPPRHYVPAAQEFGDAIRWGMGWGMMPEIEIGEDLLAGRLEALAPRAHVDVALYWQQWRRGSAALNDVAAAVRTAARVLR